MKSNNAEILKKLEEIIVLLRSPPCKHEWVPAIGDHEFGLLKVCSKCRIPNDALQYQIDNNSARTLSNSEKSS